MSMRSAETLHITDFPPEDEGVKLSFREIEIQSNNGAKRKREGTAVKGRPGLAAVCQKLSHARSRLTIKTIYSLWEFVVFTV